MNATHRQTTFIQTLTALIMALMLQGCTMFDSYYYEDEQQLQLKHERQQMQQRLQAANVESNRSTQEVAALRSDLRTFQDSQRQLYGVIDELRQENHQRAQEIEQLRSLVASLESRVSTTDGKWRSDMSGFRERLAQDQQKAMSKLTTNLAEELERNMSQMRKAAAAQQAASPQGFGEYTVQRGDTLSAISQAFRVSIKSLRDANGLKSDIIQVGQKLKIPAN